MRAFSVDRDLSNNHVIAWNHSEFEVVYPSLSEEIKIGEGLETCLVTLKSRVLTIRCVLFVFAGDYYLRLLLDEDDSEEKNDEHERIKKSCVLDTTTNTYYAHLFTLQLSSAAGTSSSTTCTTASCSRRRWP